MNIKAILILCVILTAVFLVACGKNNIEGFQFHSNNIIPATVVRVIDGDTIIADINGERERIRLLLIDTPETVKPDLEYPEPFGEEATEFARSIIKQGAVIGIEIDENERDRYERLLAYIWVGEKLFNELIVREGLARVAFVFPPNTRHLNRLEEAQREARENKRGIWSVDGYVTEFGFDVEAFEEAEQ